MNKEEFVKEQMKLSKEDIVANYWYTYQDNVEKLGIEHQLKLKDKEIEKLKRHIEAINRWIDSNIEAGNIYCYDTTPFPKLEDKK